MRVVNQIKVLTILGWVTAGSAALMAQEDSRIVLEGPSSLIRSAALAGSDDVRVQTSNGDGVSAVLNMRERSTGGLDARADGSSAATHTVSRPVDLSYIDSPTRKPMAWPPSYLFGTRSQDPNGEADNIGDVRFTPDGSRLLVSGWTSRNITVYDVASRVVIATIPTFGASNGMAISPDGNWACTANIFEDTVTILNLNDFSTTVVAVGDQPVEVEASPDNKFATLNTLDGTYSYIDPVAGATVTIGSNIDSSMTVYGNSESGGRGFIGSNFVFTGDGQTIIQPGPFDDTIQFTDVGSGATSTIATRDMPSGVAMADDGDTFIVGFRGFSVPSDKGVARFSAAAQTELDFLPTSDYSNTPGVAIAPDGSKGVISFLNDSAIFDFTAGTVTVLSGGAQDTNSFYESFCNSTHCFLGDYPGSVVDLITKTRVDQTISNRRPFDFAGYQDVVVGTESGFEEVIMWHHFDGANSTLLLKEPVGELPEADSARHAAFTPDGAIMVMTNVLSNNTTIYDLGADVVVAVIPTGARSQRVAVTPNGDTAVVVNADKDGPSCFIIDLQTLNTTPVAIGDRAGRVAIDAAGQFAYAANGFNLGGQLDSISKIDIANQVQAAEVFITASMGSGLGAFGDFSDMELTPDGSTIIAAGSFNDMVSILSVAPFAEVATVATGDQPAQMAVSPDSAYVYVTNRSDDTVSVIALNGAASFEIARPSLDAAFGAGTYWPITVTTTHDGQFIFIGSMYPLDYSVQVLEFDPLGPSWNFVEQFALPGSPIGLAVSPDDATLHVMTDGADNFHVFAIDDTGSPVLSLQEVISVGVVPANLVGEPTCKQYIAPAPILDGFAFFRVLSEADLDKDGDVGPADLAMLLGAWGPNPGHPADFDGDGVVGAFDLALLLGAWGACPG